MRYQDNRVVVNIERGRQYSFPDYHRVTNQIANMVRSTLGLGSDDIALLLLDNDNLSLLHFPAIFKQQATFAFGNVRDSKMEHERQIEHLRPRAVFIETRMLAEYQDLLRQYTCAIVVMDRAEVLPTDVRCFWDLVNGASDADNEVELDVHEHVAILRLTGGTTGPGKCAMYSIDHFLALRDSGYVHLDFAFDEDTRYLAFTPLSHAALIPFVHAFFSGGTTYTLNAPDLRVWCETVQSERITHSLLVPTLLYRLLDMNSTQVYDLTSLRSVIYGAAPIAPAAVGRLLAQFGQIFCQLYAATECITLVSVQNKRDHDTQSEAARKRLSSAGRVTPGVEIMIMGDNDAALPVGETGEIWLRTRGTISGYLGNPDATASEFF
jgi:fatty-acyl-CoA synthase